MTLKLNKSMTYGTTSTYENAYYIPYGAYTFGNEVEIVSIRKTVAGWYLTYGGNVLRQRLFDCCSNRKRAHKATESRTVNQVNRTNNRETAINKNKSVKIYKNNYNFKRHK